MNGVRKSGVSDRVLGYSLAVVKRLVLALVIALGAIGIWQVRRQYDQVLIRGTSIHMNPGVPRFPISAIRAAWNANGISLSAGSTTRRGVLVSAANQADAIIRKMFRDSPGDPVLVKHEIVFLTSDSAEVNFRVSNVLPENSK